MKYTVKSFDSSGMSTGAHDMSTLGEARKLARELSASLNHGDIIVIERASDPVEMNRYTVSHETKQVSELVESTKQV